MRAYNFKIVIFDQCIRTRAPPRVRTWRTKLNQICFNSQPPWPVLSLSGDALRGVKIKRAPRRASAACAVSCLSSDPIIGPDVTITITMITIKDQDRCASSLYTHPLYHARNQMTQIESEFLGKWFFSALDSTSFYRIWIIFFRICNLIFASNMYYV